MITTQNVKLTIEFNDPASDLEELDRSALRLLAELKEINEIKEARLVPCQEIPEISKSIGGFLAGMLTAEINPKNTKSIFRFLGDRLGGKPIELEVEANGKRLKVSAHSREELKTAITAAQAFISQ
jgi:hypothetical protein